MVAAASKRESDEKKSKNLALAVQDMGDKKVEHEKTHTIDRRRITSTIQKNRGLSRTKRGYNNPRVKKRIMLAKNLQKLKSTRPFYNGGREGQGGYKGELTGIKTNLVRGIKL